MNALRRHLSIGLLAAMAAGITWVSAADEVILYPATIEGTLSLASETVTNISADFYPVAGGGSTSKSTSVSGPGPHSFDLTVNGGDPDDPDDNGVAYRPSVYAYLQNPTAPSTYLRIYRNNPIVVDNTPQAPSTTVPVSFSYPVVRRANATITVAGGTLSSVQLSASATNLAANEYYNAYAYGSVSAQSSKTSWVPMIPQSNVSVSAYVTVVNGQGVSSQRSLPTQIVDLSGGDANVSWAIDLNTTGNLAGTVAIIVPSSSTATPTNYQIYYSGASSSTSGISGSITVSPSQPSYSSALTPGDYFVYLRTTFSNPQQYSDTPRTRVTVTGGATTTLNFGPSFGVARLALTLDGLFGISDLQYLQTSLRSSTNEYAYYYQGPAATIDHTIPVGNWRPYYTYFQIVNMSNQDKPINNSLYRYHYTDDDLPPKPVPTSGVTELGTEAITLIKSDIYFDVAETPAQKDQGIHVLLSSPRITAQKYDYNPNNSLRRQSVVYAYGSGTAKPVSGFTMVAEPGTYTIDARAYVNGTQTQFSGSSITFGTPVNTPSGKPVEVVLSTTQDPNDLRVTLTFDEITAGGITTIVETPLAPEPPEGFRTICVPDPLTGSVDCPPVYYDINTSASWMGQDENGDDRTALVCIRRLFQPPQIDPDATGFLDFLTLMHYGPDGWHELETDKTLVNCAASPAACGCDAQGCSIPADAFLVQVCGRTTSFSPFALFQRKPRVTNQVGGIEYNGRNGPGLQQWVVPTSGTYRVTAVGAQGAAATGAPARKGGCGAEVSGDFVLYEGEVLEVLVGQKGTATADSGGGGGGTFVNKLGVPPLVIAGGGGGVRSGALVNGRPGTLSSSGTAGSLSLDYSGNFIEGGTFGAGGSFSPGYGTGGGGMWGNGASDATYGEGGFAFFDDAQGRGGAGMSCGPAADGGYGGGGAGNGCHGGGGGGGFSGGGGGAVGGGGGSFNSGANPAGQEGKCTATGHGSVTIDLIAGAP